MDMAAHLVALLELLLGYYRSLIHLDLLFIV